MKTMRKMVMVCLYGLLILGLFLTWSPNGFAEKPGQTKCPVLQSPASKDVYVDYQGKRIYFCCPPCVQDFKKNPDKYMKQMEKDGVVPEDAPQTKKK
jgi:YHS domain-containing protein